MHSSNSPLVTFGFAALALLVAILFVIGHAAAAHRLGEGPREVRKIAWLTLLGAALWMGVTGAAAVSGVLARFDARPPPLAGLFVGVMVISCAIGFSPVGERLALGLPVAVLVGAQAFRLPLELLMHGAADEGAMPVQMSFSGWNFDIVTGITAIAVGVTAWLGRAPPAAVQLWNLTGIALLAVILAIAFASTPMIHAFGRDPGDLNTFVAYFPFVWLPSILVVAAIVGHIVLTRRLLRDARARTNGPA